MAKRTKSTTSVLTENTPMSVENEEVKSLTEDTSNDTPSSDDVDVVITSTVDVSDIADPVVVNEDPIVLPDDDVVDPIVENRLLSVIEEPKLEVTSVADEIIDGIKANLNNKELLTELRAKVKLLYGFTESRHWSDGELLIWSHSGFVDKPTKTDRGLYKASPYMDKQSIESLPLDYFKDWFEDKLIKFPGLYDESDIEQEIRIRTSAPPSWTYSEVKDFVLYGTIPSKNKDGVYFNDQVRAKKNARYWSDAELLAYANGDILATDIATDEEIVNELRRRLNRPNYIPRESILMETIQAQENRPSRGTVLLDAILPKYEESLKTNKIVTEESAGVLQNEFFNAISVVIKEDGAPFHNNWTKLLDYVNHHRKTLFSPKRRYIGFSKLNVSSNVNRNYQNLLELMIESSDPVVRNGFSQKKIEHYLSNILDDNIKNRIHGYYN